MLGAFAGMASEATQEVFDCLNALARANGKTLRYGYVLPFLRFPPLSGAPVEFPSYAIGTEKYSAPSLAVAGMIEKGDGRERGHRASVGWLGRVLCPSVLGAQGDRGVGGR